MNPESVLLQNLSDPGVRSALAVVFLLQVGLAIGLGIWIARDTKRRAMKTAPWTLALVFTLLLNIICGLIVVFLYLSVRPEPGPQLGGAPPYPGMPAPVPAWSAGAPSPTQTQPARPLAPPGPAPATAASKVRCPRCQTIFEFVRQSAGPTQVKCPSCGMEGTI